MPKDAKNRDDLAKVNLALKNLDLQFKPGQLQREQTMGQLGITKEGLEVSALPGQLDREQREGEGRILAQNLATAGLPLIWLEMRRSTMCTPLPTGRRRIRRKT